MAVFVRRGVAVLAVPAAAVVIAMALASCGSSSKTASKASTTTSPTTTRAASSSETIVPPNACPADGCKVRIDTVTKEGSELKISFIANYTPDMSRNHFHVYWDTYTSKQVSDDAVQRFGVTQGNWVPTDMNPYVTNDAVSTKVRGASTKVCVTAGDRDHNVIDPAVVDCRDVSNLV